MRKIRFWHVLSALIILGLAAGAIYKHHRQTEIDWHRTHFRMNDKAPVPVSPRGDFQLHIITAEGERVLLRSPNGDTYFQSVPAEPAAWFSVDEDGRLRYFDEDRNEVDAVPLQVLRETSFNYTDSPPSGEARKMSMLLEGEDRREFLQDVVADSRKRLDRVELALQGDPVTFKPQGLLDDLAFVALWTWEVEDTLAVEYDRILAAEREEERRGKEPWTVETVVEAVEVRWEGESAQ